MSSDFIKLTWNSYPIFIDAYRVSVVGVDGDGDTIISLNVEGQKAYCDETAEEVVAMIDKVVNGSGIGSVPLSRTFPGMDKP